MIGETVQMGKERGIMVEHSDSVLAFGSNEKQQAETDNIYN